jgi:predicted DNA-binding transcriptional regulator
MANLSPQQQRVYNFILEYQAEHRRRPTYEQIGAALGISQRTVCKHVMKLEKRGVLALLYQGVPNPNQGTLDLAEK